MHPQRNERNQVVSLSLYKRHGEAKDTNLPTTGLSAQR
jgi:hypothetical protein